MLDLSIIGGGPAGLSAGLYATRGGLAKVTMFEKGLPGGQITGSSEIENYPGQAKVSGMDLMDPWLKQCSQFGLKHEMNEVVKVTKKDDYFELTLDDKTVQQSKAVLLATGSVPKKAGFKGEEEFFGRGISTCATCDGFFYKNKEVALLGGGDSALEEAIYLSNICSKVYLIHRRDTFKAAPSTIEHIKKTKNIELVLSSSVKEVYGDNTGVLGVKLDTPKGERNLDVPGIFVFVGRDVLSDIIKDENGNFLCEVNANGEVVVDLNMRTNLKNFYAAGDIRIEAPKQVVCAAGDGARAAISAIEDLR